MNYSLVVIDMQDYFLKNVLQKHDDIIQKCKAEIIKAINDKAQIIFLEYDGYGETISELKEIVTDHCYDKLLQVTKADDDGGDELLNALIKFNLPIHIKVCGVNTDCCVYDTVSGFLHEMKGMPASYAEISNVQVIIDACASSWDHKEGIKLIKYLAEDFEQLSII